uniref:P-type Ca(2+) transporter n=1 Tax=Solanum tuberosum TaxID=4113 RepID=M1DIH0_SOLTU
MNITLDLPSEVDFSSKKRWHLAFATIYCSRAFKIKTSTKALHGAAYNPKKALRESTDTIAIDVVQDHPFFSGIDHSSLSKLVKDKSVDELANLGGVQGVAASLKSDTTIGVSGDPEDVARRHEAFGSNTNRKPASKSFFIFVWESFKDPTIIILLLCAALSLGFGIKEHGLKEGWYDGGSIYVAVFLVIAVSSISNFRQNRQFDKLSKYFTGTTKDENGNKEFNGSKTSSDDVINAVVGIVAAAVTIVVVAIPEGLPLAVTLTLAYSMKRMMADQAMVRKLSACETMGSATTICTDKTGTLTLNKMTVTKFFLGKQHVKAESHTSISAKVLELFHQGVGLNTTGSVFKSSDPSSSFEFSGSPTEKVILSWAVMELNMEMDQIKRNFNILHVEAFNSEKKKSGVLIKNISDGTIHAHWKGAAEMISRMCSHYYDLEGNVKPLEESDKEECDRIIEGMAASSLRCIAFAHKQVPKAEQKDNEHMHGNVPDNSFILLGFVGLKDPCRPGVKKAVEACQSAGVNIKMITGDNVFTAKAIARCVYNNIQKFIQFQLTVNVAALVINFVAAVSSGEVPLTAVQLLWVNLIMDTLGALALATEKPTEELMNKKPVGRTAPLITNIMWRNLMAQALYQIAVLLTLQFRGESIFGVSKRVNDTLIFNTFVLCQVFNEFNARNLEKKNVFKGIHKNKLFMAIIGITLVLQVVMVEFLKKFAITERLNWGQWGICIGFAAASWPIGWLVKCIAVPERPIFSYLRLIADGRWPMADAMPENFQSEVLSGTGDFVSLFLI